MDQTNELNVNQAPVVADITTPQEKMIPQSQVNEIVKHVKFQAAQKARSEAMEELKNIQNYSVPQNNSTVAQNNPANLFTPDQVKAIVDEQLSKKVSEYEDNLKNQNAMTIAQEFVGKLDKAKNSQPDFDEVINNMPLREIPIIVGMANQLDNCAEVIYELGKNPNKLATLYNLTSTPGMMNYAASELKKLSDSIKINKKAQDISQPNSPLTQLKSSPVRTDNGSSMTVKDFRKIFKA